MCPYCKKLKLTLTFILNFFVVKYNNFVSPQETKLFSYIKMADKKALKCKTLGAEFAHAYIYILYSITSAFYIDDHLPTLNALR